MRREAPRNYHLARTLAGCLLATLLVVGSAIAEPADPVVEDDLPAQLKRLEAHFGVVTEGRDFERVQQVSNRLLMALPESERKQIHAIKLLDDDTENAFAVPSGYIYIFNGLLKSMPTDDQLAGVVAHELTHILRKHSELINKDGWKYQLGGLLLAALTREPALYTASQLAGLNSTLQYSQKAEKEADRGALEIMTLAGYKPLGMLEFMSGMDAGTTLNPFLHEGYFLTHPYPSERKVLIADWMTAHGYAIPAQLYKSRVPVEVIEVDDDADATTPAPHLGLAMDGDLVFTFGGEPDATLERASKVATQVREALESGALEYDFRALAHPEDPMAWRIVTSRYTILELTPEDIAQSALSPKELAEQTLAKIRQILWRTRVKAHV